jgi:hypothetical protein
MPAINTVGIASKPNSTPPKAWPQLVVARDEGLSRHYKIGRAASLGCGDNRTEGRAPGDA